MNTVTTPLPVDDPYTASALMETDRGSGDVHAGVVALTVVQMAILAAFGAMGYPGGALAGIASVLPTAVASLFQPLYGLSTLYCLMLYDDLFQLAERAYTFSKLIAGFVAIGYVLRCQQREYTLLPIEPVTRWGTVLVSLFVLSSLWSAVPVLTLIQALSPVLLMTLAIISTQVINTRRRLLTIMLSLAFSTGLGGLMMALQTGPVAEYAHSARIGIGMTNLNALSVMFDIGIVASIYLIWSLRSPLIRLTLLLLIPFSIIAVLMTKSRAGLAVLPLGIVVGATLGLRGELGRKVTLLFISLLAVGGVFLVAESTGVLGTDTFERWTETRGAARGRWYIVKTGLEIIKENPELGAGYGMFSVRYTEVAKDQFRYGAGLGRDPHNSFLSVTAELGPTGLFVFTAMMLYLARCGLRVRPGPEGMFVLAVVVILGLTALKGTLWANKYLYYAIALAVSMTRMYPKQAGYGYALPPVDDEVGGYWGRTTDATPYRPVG